MQGEKLSETIRCSYLIKTNKLKCQGHSIYAGHTSPLCLQCAGFATGAFPQDSPQNAQNSQVGGRLLTCLSQMKFYFSYLVVKEKNL